MAEQLDQCRAEFEAAYGPMGFDLRRFHCAASEPWSEYYSEPTGYAWAGWQAAWSRRPTMEGWQDMDSAPKERGYLLGWVQGCVRLIQWGKTSHVPMYGWCLADQGAEDFDLCAPTHWMPLPVAPHEPEGGMQGEGEG